MTHDVSAEAVIVQSRVPLTVLSSAIAGGGLVTARTVVNLHVARNWEPPSRAGASGWEAALGDFAVRRSLPTPYVGLATSAWTEQAQVASEEDRGVRAVVVVTVGLGNPVAAGISRQAAPATLSTINSIAVVEARVSAAALVNLVITLTEVKTAVLRDVGIRCADGQPATGTSTDAVVVAATGRGRDCQFGGPISDLGTVVARAARRALAGGAQQWLERHR